MSNFNPFFKERYRIEGNKIHITCQCCGHTTIHDVCPKCRGGGLEEPITDSLSFSFKSCSACQGTRIKDGYVVVLN